MSDRMKRIRDYEIHATYTEVSGFEMLDMLDLRSDLAGQEAEMTPEERQALEKADAILLGNARALYAAVSQVADLSEVRKRLEVLPSEWWWYLDVLSEATKTAA